MSRSDQRVSHIPINTLRFSDPIQRDLTMQSNKPSRFEELLKKMVMVLYVFKILFISGFLQDDARD